jgi:hypothetical protein
VAVPNAVATVEANNNNASPFACGQFLASQRYQQIYAGAETGSGTIGELRFRRETGDVNAFGPVTLPGVTIRLSSTAATPASLSSTFAANVGADVTTVFSGDLTLWSGASTASPRPFDIVIPLTTPFTFEAASGANLLLDVTIPTCGVFQAFDAESTPGDSVARALTFGSGFTSPMADVVDTTGLVTEFVFVDIVCGDGSVDPGEACDLGAANGASNFCCTSSCQFRLPGQVCRAAAGACDPVEVCTGASATCPLDVFFPAGLECRPANGVCDLAEFCPGSGPTCPADAKSTAPCRPAVGSCDLTESCNGTSDACPPDDVVPSGTPCEDGAFCTVDTTCQAGLCAGGASRDCSSAGGACAVGSCNETNDSCEPQPSNEGAGCDDGDPCTTGDACSAGSCGGVPVPDGDGDGRCDTIDGCPTVADPGQLDADADGAGDACDTCPVEANPDQRDSDRQDGGDVCDRCALDAQDRCDTNQSAGVSIGASGGTLSTPDGRVVVTIPSGALPGPISISVTEGLSEFRVSDSRILILTELGPDGQSFAVPATLRFTWPDANSDGLVDGFVQPLPERRLRLWRNGVQVAGPCDAPAYQPGSCTTICCDMAANAWTLQVTAFSQYVVGDAEALLIPGGGRPATDCLLEWDVVDPDEYPPVTRTGLPNPIRTCVDGDPRCDRDGGVTGACAFALAACVNVTDLRLLDRDGAMACTAGEIAAATLKQPSPTHRRPERAAAGVVLQDLLAGLGPSTAADGEIVYSPPLTSADQCTSMGEIVVPLGGKRKSTLKLVTQGRTLAGAGAPEGSLDADKIQLRCLAAP